MIELLFSLLALAWLLGLHLLILALPILLARFAIWLLFNDFRDLQ